MLAPGEVIVVTASEFFHGSAGPIVITPAPSDDAFGSCSVDLRSSRTVDLIPHHGQLVETLEHVELPEDLAARVDGRSVYARQWLSVQTASLIDPGWRGPIMLELMNLGKWPITIQEGEAICAISFILLDQPTDLPYYAKKGARFVRREDQD